jgi:imidazolonepropionase-like amidohydrolase
MKSLLRISLIPSMLLAALASSAQLSPEVKSFVKYDQPRIALMDVRVIDGTGAPAQEHQEILIEKGKIAYVGAPRQEDSTSTTVLKLDGYSVIPGLVGMHEHMFYPAGGAIFHEMPISFPRLYLAEGVTSLRTTGSIEPYADLEMRAEIEAGKSIGPKMHVTGPYLEGADTWIKQVHHIHGPADARATVNFWADQGVTSFKVYNYVTREEFKAIIEAAHARGIKVTGHLCSIGMKEAAEMGIDNLEHGLTEETELLPGKKPDVCPDDAFLDLATREVSSPEIQDVIKYLVQRKVAVTSTLTVLEDFVPGRPSLQARVLDAMSAQARADYLESRVNISDTARQQRRYKGPTPWIKLFKMEMEFERDFVKQGGLLMAGVDPTGAGGALPGFGDQRQIELLVEAGFTPLEAIHIATFNGAQFLGETDRIGSIAEGKQADLVLVHGDPSTQINDIEKVEVVFKDGVGYDSQKLIDSVRGLVGIR